MSVGRDDSPDNDEAGQGGSAERDLDIACPSCGEQEQLSGRPDGDLILIACESCDATWHRDPERRCPQCQAGNLYPAPVAVIEKSRGTQLSIVSTRTEYLCWHCERDLIDAQRRSGTALMPDELPTR